MKRGKPVGPVGRLWRHALMYWLHFLQRCRVRLDAARRSRTPKTKAELLSEALFAADGAGAERLAASSWTPAFNLSSVEQSLDVAAPASYIEGSHQPVLALIVTEHELKFVATGPLAAGGNKECRILLINGRDDAASPKGRLDMVVAELRGTPIARGSAALGEARMLPLQPPEQAGLYLLTFTAKLDAGTVLQSSGLLTVLSAEKCR